MGILDRLFGKPSVARFAAEMIQALRQAGEQDELLFDAPENRLVRANEPDRNWTLNLHNVYQVYLQQPRSKRSEYVHSTARSFLTPQKGLPTDFDIARADLRPRLWLRASFEQMRLQDLRERAVDGPDLIPWEHIGEHLLATLAYDWPDSVMAISGDDLKDWEVTFYEAMEVARRNLEEATVSCAKIGDGVYAIGSGDTYDASRITLVERIQSLEVSGKHVVLVPSRDSLFITGSDDEAGLAMMAAMAEKPLEEPYSLSAVPLILEDGAWQDWIPPETHPVHGKFKELELKWIGPLYEEQKKLLDAVHERQGIDIFVASFSAVQKNNDVLVSYCVWREGVDTFLPVTHKVALMQEGRENMGVFADWTRVMEVAGELMELTDHYPRRYRVREFPDKAIQDAIGLGEL
jgi:uncharacterized protein YtpQ (UPF0354 family)